MGKAFPGSRMAGGMPTVSVKDVAGRGAEVKVIDVREPHEFNGDLGHIAGATLVPLSGWPAAAASVDLKGPVVCVCRSGGRSMRAAAELLRVAPNAEVYNMDGGMMAWSAAGLPVERG